MLEAAIPQITKSVHQREREQPDIGPYIEDQVQTSNRDAVPLVAVFLKYFMAEPLQSEPRSGLETRVARLERAKQLHSLRAVARDQATPLESVPRSRSVRVIAQHRT